jgi:UDP-N-acetylglucosamine--N-acetylmuramyl-(pentapeptide) pyrophosphoryl-undecaprenol N-acetylglucosamine transferase
MRAPRVHPVVIAAGGTGGHFAPAEALGAELIARGWRVVLMTDARAAKRGLGVFAGYEHHVIAGGGIAGRGPVRALAAAGAMLTGVAQARRLLRRLEPAAVAAFGGYPSVAPVLAARMVRPRPAIVLHEQNAVLGRANRFLARRSDLLALSLPQTTRVPSGIKTVLTGNPVRRAIVAPMLTNDYTPPGDTLHLLVLGGSLGARVFSDVVPAALAALPDAIRARLSVAQQCRAEDIDRVRDAYAASGIAAELAPYFDDVPFRLAATHLVIARAGASTVAELAASGRPSILVPLPGAIDDHQSGNARALASVGAAWVTPQPSFTPDALSARLGELFNDPSSLVAAAASARAAARPDAASRLADAVLALVPETAT